jgi:transcriptional regulator with XRE-family HTH domain
MGRTTRIRPAYLPEKLTRIRLALNLSQTEMLRQLGLEETFPYFVISKNELGTREPTALELLAYARIANVLVEVLIDDELDLPARLPSPEKSVGVKRKQESARWGRKEIARSRVTSDTREQAVALTVDAMI